MRLTVTGSLWFRRTLAVLGLALAAGVAGAARTAEPPVPQEAAYRAERIPSAASGDGPEAVDLSTSVREVLVPVSITDPLNRFQDGLGRGDLHAFDGQEALAVQDAWTVALPLRVAILLDGSSSMHERIAAARRVLSTLAADLRDGDEGSLSSFLAAPKLLIAFGSSSTELVRAAEALRVSHLGFTGIYDSAAELLRQQFARPDPVAAPGIVVLTDGLDTVSRIPVAQISEEALRLGVPIYVIGIRSPEDTSEDHLPAEERLAHRKLGEWAAGTRGRALFTTTGRDLDSELLQLMKDLRSRVMLSLTPLEGRETIQDLRVTALRPDLKVWLQPEALAGD